MTTLPLSLCDGRAQKRRAPPGGRGAELFGAGNETRTRDPNLGKVVLYQLSYSRRTEARILVSAFRVSSEAPVSAMPLA